MRSIRSPRPRSDRGRADMSHRQGAAVKTRDFVHYAETEADVAVVSDLIDNVDDWSTWARPVLAQAKWIQRGEPQPGGRGAVRRLGLWPLFIREKITSYERGRFQEYTVLSPHLFSSYLGRISLSARSDGGTSISWSVELPPRLRLVGPVAVYALDHAIERLLHNLVRAADVRSLLADL